MLYFLDSNVCIYLMNRKPASYFERFDAITDADIVISSITLAELEFGVAHSTQIARNRTNLNFLRSKIAVRKYHDGAALCYGQIRNYLKRQGALIGGNDMLIASHALAEGATLVTNNLSEFSRVPGLKVEDWGK